MILKTLKIRIYKTLLVISILGLSLTSYAQKSLNCSGGNSQNNNGTISFSIGQVFYTSNINSNGTIQQGVQLASEIFTITGTENKNIELNIQTYPNPASEYVLLQINETDLSNYSFLLYNLEGKLISKKSNLDNLTRISLNDQNSTLYILKICRKDQEIKTFKIIRN